MRQGISKNLILVGILSFALVGILGVAVNMGADNGSMSSCMFMGNQGAICTMSPIEHLSKWQQTFLAIPVLSLLMLGAFALTFLKVQVKAFPGRSEEKLVLQTPAYTGDFILKLFNPLLIAFSRGILHPKIY